MTPQERIEQIEAEARAMRAEILAARRQRNEAIKEARRAGKTLGQLARMFGVSREGARQISLSSST